MDVEMLCGIIPEAIQARLTFHTHGLERLSQLK